MSLKLLEMVDLKTFVADSASVVTVEQNCLHSFDKLVVYSNYFEEWWYLGIAGWGRSLAIFAGFVTLSPLAGHVVADSFAFADTSEIVETAETDKTAAGAVGTENTCSGNIVAVLQEMFHFASFHYRTAANVEQIVVDSSRLKEVKIKKKSSFIFIFL